MPKSNQLVRAEFTEQLEYAFENALQTTYDTVADTTTHTMATSSLDPLAREADDKLVNFGIFDRAYYVMTDDSQAFRRLLMQAGSMRMERLGIPFEAWYEAELHDTHLHESQHADMALQVGVDKLQYGVEITQDTADGEYLLGAFTAIQGIIPKIGHAAILFAPDIPSPSDKAKANALGYHNKGEVMKRWKAYEARQRRRLFSISTLTK